ncbi:MAG TPA: hypothetical protein VK605_03680, partial [Solirubrobacteraceae bacterium]|nr:hypothetical protein [Solirubrobacteraceae bacterium]
TGCTNPDAATTTVRSGPTGASVQNAGEPPAPRAAASGTQAPIAVQRTPSKAAAAFAALYVNWTYRTLVAHQRTLAAMAVGAARLSERQAAASAQHDTTIVRGHIYNRGRVVDVAPDALRSGWWAIVTREQTGGNSQYEGLSAAYHVTLAQLVPVPGGFAVGQWLPQS